ncbi:hypothetical protein ABT269_25130 [Streptomyces viridosporus]|uniref:hypothetical protein n=1 Tax=Streptomyces viridosporus TaxID=67581 RepID=UPI0033168B6E
MRRGADVRPGPSLDGPGVRLPLPDVSVAHETEGRAPDDEVVEDRHPDGAITGSVKFRPTTGGWSAAVGFEPETVAGILDGAAPASWTVRVS